MDVVFNNTPLIKSGEEHHSQALLSSKLGQQDIGSWEMKEVGENTIKYNRVEYNGIENIL